MDESTEETQARQAAALSGEIDQEVGENGVLVSGGGADARVLRSQEAPDAGAFVDASLDLFGPRPRRRESKRHLFVVGGFFG